MAGKAALGATALGFNIAGKTTAGSDGSCPKSLKWTPACSKASAGAEAKEPGFDPEGKQLYINPEECIDCGACEPECPVEAIFEESEIPEEWSKFIPLNYEYFGQEYSG